MLYEKMTAAEAVLHFAKNGYKMAVYEMPGQRERDRVRKIINDAKRDRVSDKRAKALLEKYGGDRYRITTAFEVAVQNLSEFNPNTTEFIPMSENELDELLDRYADAIGETNSETI